MDWSRGYGLPPQVRRSEILRCFRWSSLRGWGNAELPLIPARRDPLQNVAEFSLLASIPDCLARCRVL